MANPSYETFLEARDFLLRHRNDYEKAYREFRWPRLDKFNWATDWFDELARRTDGVALKLVRENEPPVTRTFAELSQKSSQVANFLAGLGLAKGDRLLVMLPNLLPLWETMLGAMKLGVVVVPTSVQAASVELADRVARGNIKCVLTNEAGAEKFAQVAGDYRRCVVGRAAGWIAYDEAESAPLDFARRETAPDDPFLLYFTSGTTAKPKLVLHTQRSYPVGHLSTMYWIGVRPGDVHQNISSPGWAKHAWSSFFAPWNAGATIFVHEPARFQASQTLHWLEEAKVNTLCAPPTVWRMLLQETLGARPSALRELVSAGEPLNPEVIEQIEKAWSLTIRDGFGQTETTAQIGNSVGQKLKSGSMGRPLPGYHIALLDENGHEAREGEIALRLDPRPAGLMASYSDDPERTRAAMAGGYYRTGDEATIDDDGYVHFVGRGDDVFKRSDYRISPFELESVLLEHPDVAEAAVVPSPDPLRLCVPKAFVLLKAGVAPSEKTGHAILTATNAKMAAYKRIRKIEFGELPKTISGKIRRVQLRNLENERARVGAPCENEFKI